MNLIGSFDYYMKSNQPRYRGSPSSCRTGG